MPLKHCISNVCSNTKDLPICMLVSKCFYYELNDDECVASETEDGDVTGCFRNVEVTLTRNIVSNTHT